MYYCPNIKILILNQNRCHVVKLAKNLRTDTIFPNIFGKILDVKFAILRRLHEFQELNLKKRFSEDEK